MSIKAMRFFSFPIWLNLKFVGRKWEGGEGNRGRDESQCSNKKHDQG